MSELQECRAELKVSRQGKQGTGPSNEHGEPHHCLEDVVGYRDKFKSDWKDLGDLVLLSVARCRCLYPP